ncbi:type II toxin-antitoxin system HipA family toxin [Paraburkholderia sp. J67]|uniref:type II toxin-antitoxin system HipA family toxin n=1 Tax=Paraburkholderia sp. J67 TaxID=2805435 RepID=UPI002ABD9F9D|nr:type II toxin-antitoxin system HipA family toxin [Paraburkholderia sp. J67]
MLDVYVDARLVGTLAEEAGRYEFTYLPDVPVDALVSLLMPVRAASYSFPRLHPFFQMNLPEGYKKDVIRHKLGPHADVSDFGLLALTGANTIGRVRVILHGERLESAQRHADMATLLASTDSRERLLRMLEEGVTEGVSGVMPKALTRNSHKATVWTDEFILKTGFEDLPWLALNEYLCLEVARHSGLEVPQARISDDGQVLAVRRFDRGEAGQMLAVEDFCALEGLDPVSKYKGSLERVAKLAGTYIPRALFKENARRLFTLLLVNYVVHNADAHLKNFALVYTDMDNVRLAPVYDVLTPPVYPSFADAAPALDLQGRRVWASGKLLATYGGARLGLSKADTNECLAQVVHAVHTVTPLVAEYAQRHQDFREHAKRLLDIWAIGLEHIKPDAKPGKSVPAPLREQMGLSDPDDVQRTKQTNPYSNPDGPFGFRSR